MRCILSNFLRNQMRYKTFIIMFFLFSLSLLHSQARAEEVSLKVALLPILDSLPFYFAKQTGIMKAYGVEAEVLAVASALERNQLMQSGRVDGMLTEMITTASFNRNLITLKIVRNVRISYPDYPMFRILAPAGSPVRSLTDLKGIPIAISKNTIIEFVTDRLLINAGLKEKEIAKQSVPVIPERFQLLMQGRIKAATLPDPLARSAMEAGAIEIASDSAQSRCAVSVLAFTTRSVSEKTEAVRRFLAAWDEAAALINSNPESARAIMLMNIPFPANIRASFKIPTFPRNGVPDKDQWDDAIKWMLEKRLIDSPPAYHDSVTDLLFSHDKTR